MSPSETLRAAATKIRETAALQPPWPWRVTEDQVIANDGIEIADVFALSGQQTRNTAGWITMWHPGVALLVADLLDEAADDMATGDGSLTDAHLEHLYQADLALARAINGGSE